MLENFKNYIIDYLKKQDEDRKRNICWCFLIFIFILFFAILGLIGDYCKHHPAAGDALSFLIFAVILYCLWPRILKLLKYLAPKIKKADEFSKTGSDNAMSNIGAVLSIAVYAGMTCLVIGAFALFFPLGIVSIFVCYKYANKISNYLEDTVVIRTLLKQISFNIKALPLLLPLYLFFDGDDKCVTAYIFIVAPLLNIGFLIKHRESQLYKLWAIVFTFGLAAIWIFGKTMIKSEMADSSTDSVDTIDNATTLDSVPNAGDTLTFDSTPAGADIGTDLGLAPTTDNTTSFNAPQNVVDGNSFNAMPNLGDMNPAETANINLDSNLQDINNHDSSVTVSTFDNLDSVTFKDNQILDNTNMEIGNYGVDSATGDITFHDNAGRNLGSFDPNTNKTYNGSGNFTGEVHDNGAVTTYTDAEGNTAISINLDGDDNGAPIVDSKTGKPIAKIK